MITFKILREQNAPPAPAPKQKQTPPPQAVKQPPAEQAPTTTPEEVPTQEQPSQEQAAADFVVKTANDAIAQQFDELEKKLVAAVQNAVSGKKQPAPTAQKTAPGPSQKPAATTTQKTTTNPPK